VSGSTSIGPRVMCAMASLNPAITRAASVGLDDIESRHQQAAQRRAEKQRAGDPGMEPEAGRRQSRSHDQHLDVEPSPAKTQEKQRDHLHGGSEDDFRL
jgi:hypothetical protein